MKREQLAQQKAEEQDAIAAAVAKVQDSDALVRRLHEDIAQADRDLRAAEEKVADLALQVERGEAKDAVYNVAAAALDQKEAERDRKLAALDAASRQLAEDKKALWQGTHGKRQADAKKLASQRQRDFDELIELETKELGVWQRIHRHNATILAVFPELGTSHGGCLLSRAEVLLAVETELARISAPLPLKRGDFPALPGAKISALGNPHAAKPLSDLVRQANEALVKRVVSAPMPGDTKVADASNKRTSDDPTRLSAGASQPLPEKPTFDASQIVATIGKQSLA